MLLADHVKELLDVAVKVASCLSGDEAVHLHVSVGTDPEIPLLSVDFDLAGR